MPKPLTDPGLIDRFAAITGEPNALTEASAVVPHLVEPRGLYNGESPLVLRPGNTDEVAAILKLAHETGTAVVPQGGNTGLVGGQSPRPGMGELVISLNRLNKIRSLDAVGQTMVAEAGVILQQAQEAASEAGLLFPLSLGSEGTCQIGGNLSSNAGGTAVLAYGNMRQLCLGLEVVLPDGQIWNGLRALKKDNTGYDLRDLFIGAEGTLGIITAAVLKLFPAPRGQEAIFAGVNSPQSALELFRLAQDVCGPSLTGFELMPRISIEFSTRHVDGVRDPLVEPHPWYALIDISSSQSQEAARAMLETLFLAADDTGLIRDAAAAETGAQRRAFWHLRESIAPAQRSEGGSIKHDVSVPVARVPEFLDRADSAVQTALPGARVVAFGHLGDGNIHYNISQPPGADTSAFLSRWKEINRIVHAIVLELDGSISAEHGIGQLKRDELAEIRSPVEMALMRRIKQAIDPEGIMNPGKLVAPR